MRFYRLEKKNWWKIYTIATFKNLAIALLLVLAIMLMSGYQFMTVISGSMEPTLPTGSLIIVTPRKYEDLKLGDIVTMKGSGLYFTHRIVGKKDVTTGEILEKDDPRYDTIGVWYTKGDNNTEQFEGDGPINKEVVGVVYEEHCSEFLGTVVRYVKANYKMMLALGVIFILFVEVMHYLKDKMEPDDIECYELDEE